MRGEGGSRLSTQIDLMSLTRRQLLQSATSACTASLVTAGAALVALPSMSRAAQVLRPPGALAEEEFLGACLRCGLCVRDCPPKTLKLSDWGDVLTRDWATAPLWERPISKPAMCHAKCAKTFRVSKPVLPLRWITR